MKPSRRTFLAGGGAALAFGLPPKLAHGELNLGDIRLDVVSDGSLTLPGGFLFDPMPKDELAAILSKYDLPADVLEPPCNVTLMRHGDRTALFDVGSGPGFAPNSGILLASLEALGVAAEDVTDVVFTHAHPDHLWGLLDDFGDPLFAQASYMIGKTKWDYRMDPNTVNAIGDARASFAVGAKRRLEMIEGIIGFHLRGNGIGFVDKTASGSRRDAPPCRDPKPCRPALLCQRRQTRSVGATTTYVIPGHGHPTNMAQLRRYTRDYLVYLRENPGAHLDNGGDLAEVYYVVQAPSAYLWAVQTPDGVPRVWGSSRRAGKRGLEPDQGPGFITRTCQP